MAQWANANAMRQGIKEFMNTPWYESTGPCSHQVRDDVYNKYFKGKNNSEKRSIDIQNILMDVVPEHRNDFGSLRGYATFGRQIHKGIIKEFARKYAETHKSKRIRNEFIRHWINHSLYRFPNGLRDQKLKEEFYDNA